MIRGAWEALADAFAVARDALARRRGLRWLAIVLGTFAIVAFAVFVLPIVNLRHC